MNTLERRRYPRYGFQSDIELLTASTVLRAFVTDISLCGMFVIVNTPFLIGTRFTGRMLLDPPLFLPSVVRRVIPNRGMGVNFEDISADARERLEKLVASLAVG